MICNCCCNIHPIGNHFLNMNTLCQKKERRVVTCCKTAFKYNVTMIFDSKVLEVIGNLHCNIHTIGMNMNICLKTKEMVLQAVREI